jgi:hypothetical protein
MAFYICSNQKLPLVEFDKNNPSFHTTELSKEEQTIYQHTSFPNALYFGSNLSCGCGFKHSLKEDNYWFDVLEFDAAEKIEMQSNHEKLFKYVSENAHSDKQMEIYGCWDGDLSDPHEKEESINIAELIEPGFHFKERCLYIVNTAIHKA